MLVLAALGCGGGAGRGPTRTFERTPPASIGPPDIPAIRALLDQYSPTSSWIVRGDDTLARKFVIGGRTAPAFRRAVSQGHGWYGFGLDVDATRRALEGLREASRTTARPPALGTLEISITPGRGVGVDRATCEQYAALGVHRLILMPSAKLDADGLVRYVETVGHDLVGLV